MVEVKPYSYDNYKINWPYDDIVFKVKSSNQRIIAIMLQLNWIEQLDRIKCSLALSIYTILLFWTVKVPS